MPESTSPINAPHESETPDAASSWFDGEDNVAPPADVLAEDDSPTAAAEAEVAAGPLPTEPEDADAAQAALDDGEGAEAPAEPPVVQPEPAPGVDQADDGDGGDPPVPPGESTEAAAKASGTTERTYIVLREYELDEAMLKSLLEAVKKGEEPLKVLFRFDAVDARNIEHAIRLTWERKNLAAEHEKDIVPSLGAVPERNLKVRPVKPRVRETVKLQFG